MQRTRSQKSTTRVNKWELNGWQIHLLVCKAAREAIQATHSALPHQAIGLPSTAQARNMHYLIAPPKFRSPQRQLARQKSDHAGLAQ